MDEITLYLWFSWMLFIIVTFFLRVTNKRTLLLIWMLAIIASSNFHFSLNEIELLTPYVFLIIGAVIFYVHINKQLFKLLNVFMLMISVAAILLWQLLIPAWYILTTIYFIPVIIILIIVLLLPTLEEQITISLLGVSSGQLLYDIIVMSYHLDYTIGSTKMMIQICIIVLILLIIHFVHLVFLKLKRGLHNELNLN